LKFLHEFGLRRGKYRIYFKFQEFSIRIISKEVLSIAGIDNYNKDGRY